MLAIAPIPLELPECFMEEDMEEEEDDMSELLPVMSSTPKFKQM